MLREAVVRKTGVEALPAPKILSPGELLHSGIEGTRVKLQATLAGSREAGADSCLEMESGSQAFTAMVAGDTVAKSGLVAGSILELTGVPMGFDLGSGAGRFELLVNSAADIRVVSRPPWWTLRRLVFAVSRLGLVLLLAVLWITQLRRKVDDRTRQLALEVHEREAAEQRRVLAEERARIARDLHDDLGTSLTEVSMLGGGALQSGFDADDAAKHLSVIADRASSMVSDLDVIVWAVDPEKNQLQAMVDYVAGYAGEFLIRSGIEGRFNIPIELPPVEIEGRRGMNCS